MSLSGFDSISANEIKINEYELAMRLKTQKGFRTQEIEMCLKRLLDVVDCKYAYARVPVKYLDEGKLDCGFGEFESQNLLKNFKGCQETFVFAVTLGIAVDRLLNKLSAISTAEYFITDAIASALAESAMDEAEKRIKGNIFCRPRFSPGFGDLSLEVQPKLLKMLNAQRTLGITIGKSHLMAPMKSVTAIMGII